MIKIRNIHKTFGESTILRGINLDVGKGQVVVILGRFRLRQNDVSAMPKRVGNARRRTNRVRQRATAENRFF